MKINTGLVEASIKTTLTMIELVTQDKTEIQQCEYSRGELAGRINCLWHLDFIDNETYHKYLKMILEWRDE